MQRPFARIRAEEAFRAVSGRRASKWPDRASGRVEPICLPELSPGFSLERGASVLTIGSCFARHIEFALASHGITVPTLGFRVPREELLKGTGLPTGILNKYSPFAMLNEVEAIGHEDDGRRFLIDAGEGMCWDGQLHSHETVTWERGLRRRKRLRELYARAIAESAAAIVTLGLIECWWDEENKVYLNDTVPLAYVQRFPGRFFFDVLSPEQTIAAVVRLVEAMYALNPAQKMLLTVSPVPFQRSFSGEDAIRANSYSKAALRVAAEVAARSYDHVDYFPSFESVTLSDRAEAWEDDLLHVRPPLIDRNVARMIEAYLKEPAAA